MSCHQVMLTSNHDLGSELQSLTEEWWPQDVLWLRKRTSTSLYCQLTPQSLTWKELDNQVDELHSQTLAPPVCGVHAHQYLQSRHQRHADLLSSKLTLAHIYLHFEYHSKEEEHIYHPA